MVSFLELERSVSVMRKELQNLRKQVEHLKHMLKSETLSIKRKVSGSSEPHDDALRRDVSAGLAKREPPSPTSLLSGAAIGTVRTCFREKNGTPRQPGLCPSASGIVRIEGSSAGINPSHSLEGLEEYSHAWLLFVFHCNTKNTSVKSKVKPPRLGGEKRGVFATRSPHRPCPVGLSLVRVDKVVGDEVYVSGVDLVDGTPILDIKPYIPAYDDPVMHLGGGGGSSSRSGYSTSTESEGRPLHRLDSLVRVAPWLHSPSVAKLEVEFTSDAELQLSFFQCRTEHTDSPTSEFSVSEFSVSESKTAESHTIMRSETEQVASSKSPYLLQTFSSLSDARQAIVDVLEQDPRSVYRREKCPHDMYKFSVDNLNISCRFEKGKAVVIDIQPKTRWKHKNYDSGGI